MWNPVRSQFVIDSVKVYDYLGGGRPVVTECRAKSSSTVEDLCSASSWACEGQDYVDVEISCDSQWILCCQDSECSHQQVVEVVSGVYEEYDSQVWHMFTKSHDFLGATLDTPRTNLRQGKTISYYIVIIL